MLYRKVAFIDVPVLADYLGIDRLEFCGGEIRHRKCPNCTTFEHQPHYEWVDGAMVSTPTTSAYCTYLYWRCPGCTHGNECGEMREGTFRKLFVRGGKVLRFISRVEFAERIGKHPSTVGRWIRTGKVGVGEGVIRGEFTDFIDTQKCPLLKRRRRTQHQEAA